ncbi:NADPH:adrenodoxin oxidoreductase, mitochondrial [Mycena sanguinolenta]|uniref:NADPH:adrenodoxin oxidoreductase, mitochondrial n=1 Tax=Mycena sanguinolenta TaxID=230812 RepID=A0A8H6Z7B6_9AGAR|nr:NADPH:adrenodoxin oxidoreductase, mitochondrial [Mycena sanguinolenta]
MKVAIVGGGPSAFYVASRLLSRMTDARLRVHLFDRLWAPHGLVRYGVAPDHPEVKNCTNKFDQVAADARFRFFGNVNVGTPPPLGMAHTVQLGLDALQKHYSHLIFATGCTLPALHTALLNSPWCMPALGFVHWYTQHPSAPPPPALDTLTHVSLIGNGNVALDIARILLTPPDVLEKYDVPQPVLQVLRSSTVRHVDIIARRGPINAAFTAKELRELINLPDASMRPIAPELLVPPESASRQQTRILQLLAQGSRNTFGTTPKTWALDFFKSPLGIEPPPPGGTQPQLLLTHTSFDAHGHLVPHKPAPPLSTSLVIPSLGFRAEPAARFFDPAFGHLRAQAGRLLDGDGRVVPNVYASGWAANGAKGVLATTMMDAYAVADVVLKDLEGGNAAELSEMHPEFMMNPTPGDDLSPLKVRDAGATRVVTYPDWKRVDAEEVRRGELLGKERERMRWDEAEAFLWGETRTT